MLDAHANPAHRDPSVFVCFWITSNHVYVVHLSQTRDSKVHCGG